MSQTVKGVIARGKGLPVELVDINVPKPGPGEVAVHDNTTLNIYQGVHMALGLRPDRKVVVVASDEFPTDRFVVEGIAHDLGLTVRSVRP